MHDEVGFYHLGILSASVFKFQSIQKWFWASSLSPPVCLETSVSLLWLHKLSLTFIAACSFASAWIQIGRWCKPCIYSGCTWVGLRICYLGHIFPCSIHGPQVTDRLFAPLLTGKLSLKARILTDFKKLNILPSWRKAFGKSPCEEAPFTADERRVQLTSCTSGSSHLRQHNS